LRDLKALSAKAVRPNRPQNKRQPRDWKGIFLRLGKLCVLSLLIAGACLYGPAAVQRLQKSALFQVQGIEVVEGQRVSAQEILDLSELRTGMGLFELDPALVGRRIEANPWIAQAQVQRVFPNRLIISVREHSPRAIVNLGYLYYLDAQGEVFKVLDGADELDFPVITGISREQLLEAPREAKEQLALALSLTDLMEERSLFNLAELSEIHVSSAEGLTVYTVSGAVPIRFGRGDFPAKLERLEHIYQDLRARLYAIRYIDLNISHRVIVKVAEPGVGKG